MNSGRGASGKSDGAERKLLFMQSPLGRVIGGDDEEKFFYVAGEQGPHIDQATYLSDEEDGEGRLLQKAEELHSLNVIGGLSEENRVVVFKNSFRWIQAATEFALHHRECKALWEEGFKGTHVDLARGEKWKGSKGPWTYQTAEGELDEDALFEDVWDFVMQRYLRSLNLPPMEAVELILPQGYFVILDNFVVHAGARASRADNMYRLHIYIQRLWERTSKVARELEQPEQHIQDFRWDRRLFPLVRHLCQSWNL